MHSRNSIHRYLKPENVVLDENLHPKIGDHGLARRIPSGQSDDDLTFKGEIRMAEFMAPELFGGCPESEIYGSCSYLLIWDDPWWNKLSWEIHGFGSTG
jgi:serine/threonine protein kinase